MWPVEVELTGMATCTYCELEWQPDCRDHPWTLPAWDVTPESQAIRAARSERRRDYWDRVRAAAARNPELADRYGLKG